MWDVVVVGAGPAGSSAALTAAQRGLSVLLLERRKTIGEPVQCGEFVPSVSEMKLLLPRSRDVDQAFSWLDDLAEVPIDSFRFIYGPTSRPLRTVKVPFSGVTLDRGVMDRLLADLAVDAGAVLRTGTRFIGIKGTSGSKDHDLGTVAGHAGPPFTISTSGGEEKTRSIIAADGPFSKVAASLGLEPPRTLSPCILGWTDERTTDSFDLVMTDMSPGGYAWAVPKADGMNIGIGVQRTHSRDGLRELFDRFCDHLGVTVRGTSGGWVPVSGPIPRTYAPGVMVVGDAAGHVMASNGGGVPLAVIGGRMAGRSMADVLEGNDSGMGEELFERRWKGVAGELLETARVTKVMADPLFRFPSLLGHAMDAMGPGGLSRMVRCRPLTTPDALVDVARAHMDVLFG